MIEHLITLLQKAGLEVTGEDIADLLWLATKLDVEVPTASTHESERPSAQTAQPRPEQGTRDEARSHTATPDAASSPDATVPLYPNNVASQPRSPASTAPAQGVPFQTPAATALRHALELGRSLRPLMRKVPSRTELVLDEEATATQIAERQVYVPVFCPAPERWLDLALVVEASPSTAIWDAAIAEFQRLVERQGAFRDVRTWSLQVLADGTQQLFPRRASATANPQPRSPGELSDPAGRRLIWLISDCTSAAWQQRELYDLLTRWAADGPVALIQLLPDRLWERTALGYSFPVQLQALLPGVPNTQLIETGLPEWEELNPATALKLPVITLEPGPMRHWAQVMAGMGNVQTAGVVVDTVGVVARSQEAASEQPRQLSADALVQRFRTTASPLAQRLAGMMAAVPVSLPVIHLIQQTLLPESTQVHVAEVLMSGLLQRSDLAAASTSNSVQYEFVDETIRDLLIDGVAVPTVDAVLEAVSQYIARKAGLSIHSFTALLVPDRRLEGTEGAGVLPFAQIAKRVLQRIGGEYAALVEEIEQEAIADTSARVARIDETVANAAFEQHLEYIQQEILEAFSQQDHQFQLVFPGLRPKDLAAQPAHENIALVEGEEISVTILEHSLIGISEDHAAFELGVKINFAAEIRYFDFDAFHPVINPHPTFEETVPNQTVDAVAEVNLWFLEEDANEVEPELVRLRIEQPILVNPIRVKEDSSVSIPPLQTFEFEVATIAFAEDSESPFPPLQTQEVEVVTIVLESSTENTEPVPDWQRLQFEVATLENQHGEWVIQRQPQQRVALWIEPLSKTVELEMVLIPAGNFLMGSPDDEPERRSSEGPQHKVNLEAFLIGRYPVTQVQWRAVAAMPQINQELAPKPSRFKGDNRPVERVSWHDAVEFCDRLSAHTRRAYRLPSEAEWEYACRAGTTTPFHFGETITPDLANYSGNYSYNKGTQGKYRQQTTPVDHFGIANAFGLCDMHGNVWEWCEDDWHDNYQNAPTNGSAWIAKTRSDSSLRVLRGGSWIFNPRFCRSASRYDFLAEIRFNDYGFRVCCSAPSTP